MRIARLVVLAALVACDDVPKADARSLTERLEEAAQADTEVRPALFGLMCYQLESCARKCKETLAQLGNVAPEQRVSFVAAHCDASAASLPASRDGFAQWLEGYVGAYVAKARSVLPDEERARLDQAWSAARFVGR